MKYSIIVPVYNAERTLKRCVDSILNQKYKDYEIILVNDGSSDNSLEICNSYSKMHSNIKVIDKKNGGASSARNAGLDIAAGQFILFVDSDDYVSDHYFEVIDNNVCPDGLSVLTFTWIKAKGLFKREINDSMNDAAFFDKSKYLILSRDINSPYSKIFDKKLIDKISLRFDERMPVAEDFNFCLKYLMACDNVKIKNDSIYFYDVTNEDSLVRKKKDGLIDIYPIVFDYAYNTINQSPFGEDEKLQLFRIWDKLHVDSFGTCVMEEFKDHSQSAKEIKKQIKSMCEKFYSQYSGGYGYQNIIHRIMRLCIKNKWSNALYLLGKMYVKLRG